jgi:rubredoxin
MGLYRENLTGSLGRRSGGHGYNVCSWAEPDTVNIMSEPKTWMCLICGWIYDEAAGAPDEGIAPGTPWDQVPINWTCPECGARKDDFEMVQI